MLEKSASSRTQPPLVLPAVISQLPAEQGEVQPLFPVSSLPRVIELKFDIPVYQILDKTRVKVKMPARIAAAVHLRDILRLKHF